MRRITPELMGVLPMLTSERDTTRQVLEAYREDRLKLIEFLGYGISEADVPYNVDLIDAIIEKCKYYQRNVSDMEYEMAAAVADRDATISSLEYELDELRQNQQP